MTRHRKADSSPRIDYPARITRQRDGEFLVEFPDLPGCLTEGETREEALENAREALSAWLYAAVKTGEDIPEPSAHRGRNFHRVSPDLDVTIPLLILMARKRKGWTQEEMAATLGVTQQAYRKLEIPGKSNPTLKTLSRLIASLGLELELRQSA